MPSVIIGDNCSIINSNFISDNDTIIINGRGVAPPPTKCKSITTINGKVYIDGYEFKNGKWIKTLKALWHLWF